MGILILYQGWELLLQNLAPQCKASLSNLDESNDGQVTTITSTATPLLSVVRYNPLMGGFPSGFKGLSNLKAKYHLRVLLQDSPKDKYSMVRVSSDLR